MSVRNPRNKKPQVDDDGAQTATGDVPWNILAPIVLCLLIALLFFNPVNPPIEPDESALYITSFWDETLVEDEKGNPRSPERTKVLKSAGAQLMPGHSRADLDLWVAYQAPDLSCQVVGYPGQLRRSDLLKLDEDDRGWNGHDAKDDINREVVGARTLQLPKGLYRVSVHLFSPRGEAYPVTTELKIVINKGRDDQVVLVWDIDLEDRGQERGVAFRINEEGNLVPGSVIEPTEIRIATGSTGCNRRTASHQAGATPPTPRMPIEGSAGASSSVTPAPR